MRDLFDGGRLLRVLLIGIVTALLGLYPFPRAVTTSLGSVYNAQETDNYAAVATNLVRVAEQQPWRSGFWEAAGDAELAAGEAQTAAVYFAHAAAKGELSPGGYLAWGDADWLAENYQTAVQIWDIAARHGISPDEILPRQAKAYRVIGDDLALIEILQSIVQQRSAVISQPAVIGPLYYELGLLLAAYDPETAPAYLLQAVELDPSLEPQVGDLISDIQEALAHDDPAYLLLIAGRALANQGYWDLAAKAFENAVESHPEYAEAWAYLGEAWQHASPGGDPLMVLETALKLDPASIAANTFTALYWQRRDEYEPAIGYFQTAAKLDPDNPTYLVEIGNMMALLGDLDAGRDYHWQAVVLSQNDPVYVREFLKFNIRFKLNLHDMALPVARQLVMLNPDDPASLDLMGEILFWLGDMLNAERFFLRALAQDPEYDHVHLHLGDLYRSQGKHDLANYHYRQVLEVSRNALTTARAQEALDPYILP